MKERLLSQLIKFMDESYILKSFAETLSVNDINDIDAELEETLSLWGDEKKVNDNLLKDVVKTYTKLAKKYTIDEKSVNQFYDIVRDLSFDKNGMNTTLEKERTKMAKQMKKIWGAQSNGTMEKNHYAGKVSGTSTNSTDSSDEDSEEQIQETVKQYKKIYPKLVKEMHERGIEKVIVQEKPSDASIDLLVEYAIECVNENGTNYVILETEEVPDKTEHYLEDEEDNCDSEEIRNDTYEEETEACDTDETEEEQYENITEDSSDWINEEEDCVGDVEFEHEEIIIIDEKPKTWEENHHTEKEEELHDEDEEDLPLIENFNRPLNMGVHKEKIQDEIDSRDWISEEDKIGIFTEEELRDIKRW